MIRKLFLIGALMLVVIMGISGCGEESHEIDFTIGYNNLNTEFPQNLECIVNTFEEWDILRGDTAQYTELDAKYSEQFFDSNSLVIYAFTENYGGGQTEITKVSTKRNELIVDMTHHSGDMAIIAHSIVIIEVKKMDIAGINSLRIASENL